MGADSLADLPKWREPAEICKLAVPLVVRRSGQGEPDFSVLASLVSAERLQMIAASQVAMPLIDLSASDLRRRVAAGQSIRYRTPRLSRGREVHRDERAVAGIRGEGWRQRDYWLGALVLFLSVTASPREIILLRLA